MNEFLSLGLYGSGMHDFLMDELELGERVAEAIDDEAIDPLGWYFAWLYVESEMDMERDPDFPRWLK